MAASERQLAINRAITGLRVALNHYGAATLAADSTRQSCASSNSYLGKEGADQGRSPGRADGRDRRARKNTWGTLTGDGVPHEVRDPVMDFVRRRSEKTEIGVGLPVG
jgi:hypothetical protein